MNYSAESPIGIFDSGVGGLTVAGAIAEALPNEQIIYFGDTAHLPYGEKSHDSIIEYSLAISDFLYSKNCKTIIIACNSASSHAYDVLKEKYAGKIQIINVVDPVVKGVQQRKDSRKIGIIGTKATISSKVYVKKLEALEAGLDIFDLATPLLAPMVEEGYYHNIVSQTVIKNYLDKSAIPNDIDTIILACTHYPLLKQDISDYYQKKVAVLDSTDFVVDDLKKNLESLHLLSRKRNDKHQFFVSEYTESFREIAQLFFKETIDLKHYPIWS